MERLPKRTESKTIGNVAADLLSAILSRFSNVVPIPESRDLGIDFYCELIDRQDYPTGQIFNIQCKGTDEVKKEGDSFSIPVKITTANYWLIQPAATFLVVVDLGNKNCYWAYPRKQLSESSSWEKQKTVSITVHTIDRFQFDTNEMPHGMRAILDDRLPEGIETLIEQFDSQRPPVPLDDPEYPSGRVQELMGIADTMDTVYRLQQRMTIMTSRLQDETLQVVASLRQKSEYLLGKFDYTPSSAQLWPAGSNISIFDFEFGAGSCKDVWRRVDRAVSAFRESRTRENHAELLASLGELIQLNRDIYWTIEDVFYSF
ncbi:DUF4365 domain-containing protein (plasmid) [Nostoc sp. C052]|uniref:DUF4365 domain-containing protein n=1 Tax=Nostoc sp. C052 TaxID=2576902 RepID=UPI0015C34B88|nr:DUF4365 domain-containing protein [Nostoc sp. C052]QLE46172.1 DUF4365 domain-containing protein [Nostoc sp. C052]